MNKLPKKLGSLPHKCTP